MTVLAQILSHKADELADARVLVPLAEIKARAADSQPARPFAPRLRRADNRVGLIAEVKKASPSAGVIRADFDPVKIAQIYQDAGADCLSVLTDKRYFQGSLDYLVAIRQAVGLPLLRKDFTIDPYQIYEARAAGADAVLLIAAALAPSQIADFAGVAEGLGMAALVETHTEDEMAVALEANPKLIGINSRDLKTFVTDLAVIERLAAMAPAGATLVGESGIKTPADVARLRAAGVHAILVGETLMRAPDIAGAVRELVGEPGQPG